MKNVLIVNPFGIGDVLFTTPMIKALKSQPSGISISYLGNARTAPILRNDPRIDKVLVYERDEFVAVYKKSPWRFLLKWWALIQEIRSGAFDVAFDLSMGGPLGFALMLAGVPQRIGFNYKGRGRWLTHSVPLKGFEGRHVTDYNLDLLRHWTLDNGHSSARVSSVECQVSSRMSIFTSSSDDAWADGFLKENNLRPANVIGLYPGGGASWGAGAAVRRWGGENYAKLADKIVEKANVVIILMGDQSDMSLCESVAEKMVRRPVIAAGKTTLGQSAALMKRCRFVVLNDGGAMHVAAASGVRTAVVFGPVDPDVYGPVPKPEHKSIVKGLPCQPCYRNFRMSDCKHQTCLKQLTVGEVYQQLEEWL